MTRHGNMDVKSPSLSLSLSLSLSQAMTQSERGRLGACSQGFRRMNPFCIPFAINNMGGALLAMDLGFMGPNYSISTACATGNFCILRWTPATPTHTPQFVMSHMTGPAVEP